jgi:hypothetical protein
MRRRKKISRRVKFLALFLVALCAAVPFIRADRYQERIRSALEQALNRKVEINGPVRLMLLPYPGFSVRGVVIHDDPSMGLEPLAYVPSLDLGLRWRSLWRRRLEFSRLSLNEPSVNLVKSEQGAWNYPPLLERAFASGSGGVALPEIRVRSGRVNFKFGLTKSVFYFASADVDVAPSRTEASGVRIRFSGEPARTDRPGGGFSTLTGAGILTFPPDGRNRVAVGLRLEPSAISEVLRLLQGHGMGLAGFIASTARLEGELSTIRITGSLEMVDFDRRILFGTQQKDASIDYRGLLNLQAQELSLESAPGQLPIAIRFRASNYLTRVDWALAATFKEFPLDSLPDLAQETGAAVPAGLRVSGALSGAFSLSSRGRLLGQLAAGTAKIEFPDSDNVVFKDVSILFDDGKLRVVPAEVSIGEKDKARLELSYEPAVRGLEISLYPSPLSVRSLVTLWSKLGNAPPSPLFSACRSGMIEGTLRYSVRSGLDGSWGGKFVLSDAELTVDGIERPVRIASALATLKGGTVQLKAMEARVGRVLFHGDYSSSTNAAYPHQLNLRFSKLYTQDLEWLLGPSLRRQSQGFIARTLRFRPPPAPDWLRQRRVEANLRADELLAGSLRLSDARARLRWRGLTAELEDVNSELYEGSLAGHIAVDFRSAVPQYEAKLVMKDLAWEGGSLDLDGRLVTAGLGGQLLSNLRAQGFFTGHSISTSPANIWDSAFGSFEMTMARGMPVLVLNSLEVSRGSEIYSGTGGTAAPGQLELVLSNESEQVEMAGTLFPLRLQPKGTSIPR